MNVKVGFGSEGDWGLGIRDWVTKSKNYVRYKFATFLNAEERGEPALLLEGYTIREERAFVTQSLAKLNPLRINEMLY
ncbi:hypothetical protein SAMD00079811_28800 [Scytonema sp. HK-05]|nr:hypothetical protein NIES2130_29790 [Scytonema sp. HK-05]BAY45277.1 hypothetical protein SAMD00079811_28800 [Scytonema sp. HK-05]